MQITPSHHRQHRRSFLHTTGKLAAATAIFPATLLSQKATEAEHDDKVSTNEGLMRENGILRRVLLMYDEVIRRIDAKQEFPAQTVRVIRDPPEVYSGLPREIRRRASFPALSKILRQT